MKAFPNPSSQNFTLSYNIQDWEGSANLRVFNLLGQQVESRDLDFAKGQVELGSDLAKGVYFVQLQSQDKLSASLKLVKN